MARPYLFPGIPKERGPGGEVNARFSFNMATQSQSLFQPALVREAVGQAFVKLDPRIMFRNPVMFTVEIGTVVMLYRHPRPAS